MYNIIAEFQSHNNNYTTYKNVQNYKLKYTACSCYLCMVA